MDANQIAIAKTCLLAAYDGSLAFPEIISRLLDAGFEGYSVDYRRQSQTYYLPNGENIDLALAQPAKPVAERFDSAEIELLVRWAQSGDTGYTYQKFCDRVTAAGCAGYLVSFPGRRVAYFGRTAETHIELFPQ
ncbi:DUF1398 domain-containing protein [Blastomonas sp.]|uniref:DUF1398 domain-containing protein n=1 Tax=Blastomonas sp. TaxID=1909299 RepID=UPI003593DB57